MVWHRTTWPVSVCALQRFMVVLGCDHRMTINCSSHGQVQLLLVRAPSTPTDQHPGTLYPLRFVIRQSHWEPLGRCWNRFCSDWEMCIGHGIRVRRSMRFCFMNDKLPPEVGVVTVTWPKFKIWDPLHKFWADKDTRSKFCTVTHRLSVEKIWPLKRRGLDHVTLWNNIWNPFMSSEFGMVNDRNFVVGTYKMRRSRQ